MHQCAYNAYTALLINMSSFQNKGSWTTFSPLLRASSSSDRLISCNTMPTKLKVRFIWFNGFILVNIWRNSRSHGVEVARRAENSLILPWSIALLFGRKRTTIKIFITIYFFCCFSQTFSSPKHWRSMMAWRRRKTNKTEMRNEINITMKEKKNDAFRSNWIRVVFINFHHGYSFFSECVYCSVCDDRRVSTILHEFYVFSLWYLALVSSSQIRNGWEVYVLKSG